jgi:hypothetical protein
MESTIFAVAIAEFAAEAEKVRDWPSRSSKASSAHVAQTPSSTIFTNGNVPVVTGARLGTTTSTSSEAVRPSGSHAVTVTVALPGKTPLIVIVNSDTRTVAISTSDD